MAVNPTSGDVGKLLQRDDVRAARTERREARAAAKAARRASSDSPPAANTEAATAQISPASTGTATASSVKVPDAPKSFRGSTKDSNVIHFAVQGGVSGNAISVFGSGEGPKAIHPEQKSTASTEQPAAATTANPTVNKVA